MARKKQEIALQAEINTQEEWDELMKKEGLLVVDVYQDWCGPCKAVINFFRRVKNEIGDDFLNFAVAKSDTIDSLEKYRGRCEPCFLIYGGRSLVGVIRGANPPVLESTIKLKLEEEHKVMKGEMERNETKDPFLADVEPDEKVQEVDKDIEEVEREITLALIKPDVVKAGKVDEIIAKLQESGIEILAQQERNLTIDEAKEFYHHMSDSEFFEDLIKFIASGPSKILVLAKGDAGIIHEFRELIGPKVVDEAKENAPQSIRAIYGSSSIENAIHGADNKENAMRELAFFFPDFMVPKVARKKHEERNVQRTLALIRPAAFAEYRDSIIEKINNSGFKIAMQKEVQLTKEDAALFYKVHEEKPFFEELITEMSKGTLLALALEKQNAVQGWRGILGPKDVEKAKEVDPNSLRAQFSRDDIKINLLHGSDSEESAEIELKYFFPVEQTIAAIKPDGIVNEEEIINRILDAKFKIVKRKIVDMDKTYAENFYSDQGEQEYFNDLIAHMESGPTLFMVLSREDAIRGWRSLIGPKDPAIAADTYPDSIRAIYGRDISANAVYGSDNQSEVQRVMDYVFGHLEFHEDGTLLPEYEDKSEIMETTEQESQNVDETEHETEKDSEENAQGSHVDENEQETKQDSEGTAHPEISEGTEVKDSGRQSAVPEIQKDEADKSIEHESSEEVVGSRRGSAKNKETKEDTVEKTDTTEKPDTSEVEPDNKKDDTVKEEENTNDNKEEGSVNDEISGNNTESKGKENGEKSKTESEEVKNETEKTENKDQEKIDETENSKSNEVDEEKHEIDGKKHEVDGKQHEVGGKKHEVDGKKHEVDEEKHKVDGKKHEVDGKKHEVDGKKHEVDEEKHEVDGKKHDKEKHKDEKTEETDKIEDTSVKEDHEEKSVNDQTEMENTADNTVQETENADKTEMENEVIEPDNTNNENTNLEATDEVKETTATEDENQ